MIPIAPNIPQHQAARGMHDLLTPKSADYTSIEARARVLCANYGFKEIRTPVLEPLGLFQRALGETTDIVEKEMFTLEDRGERELCLRPEGTAGAVRAYIEHSLDKQGGPVKLFYIGPMFRAEKPQAGRLREFVQIGCEYFGNSDASADAETLLLMSDILKAAGLTEFQIHLNSIGCTDCRPAFKQALVQYLNEIKEQLCANCRRRMERNPLRVLDCKEDREQLRAAPKTLDYLCAPCAAHQENLSQLLAATQVSYTLLPHLVRGLDYYNRSVFEFFPTSKTGSQDALAAGGRYDGLVQTLGGSPTPAVGFAMGLERVWNLVKGQTAPEARPGTFVAALGALAQAPAFKILSALRKNGLWAEAALNKQSLKAQMRLANSLGMRYCVLIGENEMQEGVVALKDLVEQSQTKVPAEQIVELLKEKTGRG